MENVTFKMLEIMTEPKLIFFNKVLNLYRNAVTQDDIDAQEKILIGVHTYCEVNKISNPIKQYLDNFYGAEYANNT